MVPAMQQVCAQGRTAPGVLAVCRVLTCKLWPHARLGIAGQTEIRWVKHHVLSGLCAE